MGLEVAGDLLTFPDDSWQRLAVAKSARAILDTACSRLAEAGSLELRLPIGHAPDADLGEASVSISSAMGSLEPPSLPFATISQRGEVARAN